MTDSEVIRMQRDVIAKHCRGDRKLAVEIIDELGLDMRPRIEARKTELVSAGDLRGILRSSACSWAEV